MGVIVIEISGGVDVTPVAPAPQLACKVAQVIVNINQRPVALRLRRMATRVAIGVCELLFLAAGPIRTEDQRQGMCQAGALWTTAETLKIVIGRGSNSRAK